jgi:hypothetical protein
MEKQKKGREINYAISMDWLEFNSTGKIPKIDLDLTKDTVKDFYNLDEIALVRNRKFRNPNFQYCYDLILNNSTVCYLFIKQSKNSRFSSKNIVRAHVYNNQLYTNGIGDKLNAIHKTLELTFRDYYKLHIAIDAPGLIKQHNHLSLSREYRRNSTITHQVTYNEESKDFDRSILGSTKSEKQICFYGKEKKLINEGKEYIRDYWTLNKVIPAHQLIDRIELRLTEKLLKGCTIDFIELGSTCYLASLFRRETKRFLEFKNIQQPDERVSIIDWSKFDITEIKKINENNQGGALSHIKITLRTLFEEYLQTQKQEILSLLCEISDRYSMNEWVNHRYERWLQSLRINLMASS